MHSLSFLSGIREEILKEVSSIIPFDPLEKKHIDFVKKWILSSEEIFRVIKPDKPLIHLVCYFIVIDKDSNALLLVDHKKAKLWLPPGGHVELNEHPRDAVKREAKEELGIEAEFVFEDPLFLSIGKNDGHTDVSLWYALRGSRHNLLHFDLEEFHKIQWFLWKEIPYERSDPHMKRFIDKNIKKLVMLNSYNVSASLYEKNTAGFHPKEEAEKFMNKLPTGAKIIDIGCGPGRDAQVFANRGFQVVGIDFSPRMVEIAKQKTPQGFFYTMDMEKILFPPHSFDGVWANCALLHIPKKNIPAVLKTLYTILKPQGTLYFSVKQGSLSESFEADGRYGGLEKYWSYYEQDELIHLLRKAEFTIGEVHISNKGTEYHTHPLIEIFAEKRTPLE